MNPFRTASRWSVYLALAGVVIVVASVWYTNRLAAGLADVENKYVQLYQQTVERVSQGNETSNQDDTSIEFEIMSSMETVPRILVNERGGVDYWSGFGRYDNDDIGNREADSLYVQNILREWIAAGRRPVQMYSQRQYFGESNLLRELRYFPWVQAALIVSFGLLGFLGIRQTQRAEQNRVWVGMAKETAHQLGTPISAIVGWVEHLRMSYADDPEIIEVANELEHDVDRLSMVANRFSKIGARPELKPHNVYAELDKCRDYMQRRAPRRVTFDFPAADAGELAVNINPLLLDWVFENLLRNALDAMDGRGHLTGRVRAGDDRVMIDISDTGRGIEPRNVRRVFEPGFTTKKRGWGLGLSLVKRIVEEYHRGKIFVSKSEPGKGTTFTISLPRA